jgi:hypothetical protein
MSTRFLGLRPTVTAGRLQTFAARSVAFLALVDHSPGSTAFDLGVIGVLHQDAIAWLGELEQAEILDVDPDGRTRDLLKRAVQTGERLYHRARDKYESTMGDPGLEEADRAAESSSTESLIAAIADYHNTLEDLREQIETRVALASKGTGEVFTSVEALMASLRD